jgi:hypothetical protein
MSRENVELVRALGEAFQRRDHERVFDFYDPEIEWDTSRLHEVVPDLADVYRGHEGVRTTGVAGCRHGRIFSSRSRMWLMPVTTW